MNTIKYEYNLTEADDFNLVNAATHTLSEINKYAFYHIIDSTCADPYLYHNIFGDCGKVIELLSKPAEKMFLDSVFLSQIPNPCGCFQTLLRAHTSPMKIWANYLVKTLSYVLLKCLRQKTHTLTF